MLDRINKDFNKDSLSDNNYNNKKILLLKKQI